MLHQHPQRQRHAALCATAFASIWALSDITAWLPSVPYVASAPAATKTDAPPLLGTTCADTASLTPQISASATAPTLLSATQHSQASEHDAAAL